MLMFAICIFFNFETFSVEWSPNTGKQLDITIPKITGSIKIDGRIDDKLWEKAYKIGNFTEFEPREGKKPPVETEVFICYNNNNIYFGFICYDDDTSKIRATLAPHDEIANDDFIWIIVDPFNDLQKAYMFAVNPYGVQGDGYISNTGEGDSKFDTNWKANAKIFEDRWEGEIAIPFKSILFPIKSSRGWAFQFLRMRPRDTQEIFSWAPLSHNNPSFLAQTGYLHISKGLSERRIISFLPYSIISHSGNITNSQNPEVFQNERTSGRIGISGKYTESSNLVLNWAINPDYSQIETDAPQIDVNASCALYYLEKRPFFMEGSDIFTSPINVIYTRSINDPNGTLKFIGKLKRTSIGYITAYDKHTPWIVPFRDYSFPVTSEKNSFSNILRIKQSILKDSYIGFLATSRDMKNSYSRVTGFDGNIRFLTNYNFIFQGLKSWTKEPGDTTLFAGYSWLNFGKYTSAFDGEKFNGEAYKLELSRGTRYWNFDIWYSAFSPTFRADNGFISRNDFKKVGMWTDLEFHPNKWIFEKISPQIEIWRRYDYIGNFRKEYIYPSFNITFKKQTTVSLFYTLSSEVFRDTKFKDIWTTGGQISTDFSKFVSGGIWGQFGKGINYYASPVDLGDIRDISLWLTLKPTSRFSSSFSSERYWLWQSEGGKEIYDVTVFQNKTSYQFTKYFSIRLVTQYQSDSKNIGIYPLISFEPNPFTEFYLGSNHTLNKFDRPYGYKESERRIFVKFRYLFEY
jgi:hypothetical protein